MPLIALYLFGGIAGYFILDSIIDDVTENLVTIVVIGGVSYYIYKKVVK